MTSIAAAEPGADAAAAAENRKKLRANSAKWSTFGSLTRPTKARDNSAAACNSGHRCWIASASCRSPASRLSGDKNNNQATRLAEGVAPVPHTFCHQTITWLTKSSGLSDVSRRGFSTGPTDR